jgi:hypothetical protein
MLVEKFQIRGAGARSCRMSPEGRYRQQTAVRNELSFVSGIRNREIEVCFRWHVEHPRLDCSERLLYVAAEARRCADIVPLPGAHLQDQIVRIRAGDEIGSVMLYDLVECGTGRFLCLSQLLPPPFLRKEPCSPYDRKCLDALHWLGRIVTTFEGFICSQSGDFALEAHDAVSIGLCRSRGCNDPVHEIRVGNGPLKRLLRAHGETDHRLKVSNAKLSGEELMHRLDVVPDCRHRKAGPAERLGRIAR